jgi:hypothetical protein
MALGETCLRFVATPERARPGGRLDRVECEVMLGRRVLEAAAG